jgi:hypothetical protein
MHKKMNMKKTKTSVLPVQHVQYGLSIAIAAALFGYAYLLCSSLAFAVSQRELAHTASSVKAEVAEYESMYLAKSQDLTEKSASSFGLVKISQKMFVETTPSLGRIDTGTVAN